MLAGPFAPSGGQRSCASGIRGNVGRAMGNAPAFFILGGRKMMSEGAVKRGKDGRFLKRSEGAAAAGAGAKRSRRPKGGAAAKSRGWTKAREEIFFRELAMVCNIQAALRAAGMSQASSDFYTRRKRDPDFRIKWDEAVSESYALLELEMLERGRLGDNRPPPANEAERKRREVPTALGLTLLKMHKSGVRRPPPSVDRPLRGAKLRDELEARLSEISRRLGGIG